MKSGKIVSVHSPKGKPFNVRLSSILSVSSEGVARRRYFLVYKSGKKREVARDCAYEVFDALQPQLF